MTLPRGHRYVPPPQTTPDPNDPNTASASGGGSSSGLIIGVIIGVLVAGAVAGAAFAYTKSTESSAPPTYEATGDGRTVDNPVYAADGAANPTSNDGYLSVESTAEEKDGFGFGE